MGHARENQQLAVALREGKLSDYDVVRLGRDTAEALAAADAGPVDIFTLGVLLYHTLTPAVPFCHLAFSAARPPERRYELRKSTGKNLRG